MTCSSVHCSSGDWQWNICRLKVKIAHRLSFYPDQGVDMLARVSRFLSLLLYIAIFNGYA